MHELALMDSIVEAIEERLGDARVVTVRLCVGRLAAVLPDALRFCFDVCAAGTSMEGAALDIVESPGRGRCRDCGAEVELEDLLSRCPCGSATVDVIGGEELRLEAVEVI